MKDLNMNNRNPNKENIYSNLAAWCDKYHKDSGIKIHPSSVPVELVLEDVMGYVALLMAHDRTTVTLMESLTKRITDLEILIHELTAELQQKDNKKAKK
jgi:aromatic ring-cleaving dioxygenase